jgi:hypothetical protein
MTREEFDAALEAATPEAPFIVTNGEVTGVALRFDERRETVYLHGGRRLPLEGLSVAPANALHGEA